MEDYNKKCGKCGVEKPHTEFNRHKANKDGLQHRCKSCVKELNKQYRLSNPEYGKLWLQSNPNYSREWRKANPEYYNEYYASNKDRYKTYNKQAKQLNHE